MEKKETKLKRIRQEKGLTQKGLADATNISLRTLQHYEQGSKDLNQAAALTVYALAQTLGVEMEELLDIPGADPTEETGASK